MSPTALSKSECNLSSSEVDPHPLFKDGKDDGLGKRKIAALKEIDPGSLCLDPSQMDAICQSLTLPVSLIQVRAKNTIVVWSIYWWVWSHHRVLLGQARPMLELS